MNHMNFVIAALFALAALKIGGIQLLSAEEIPKADGRLLTPEEGCGYSNVSNSRIVGGSPAKKGAWPWMALLFYRYQTGLIFKTVRMEYQCGGSLITSRHVLTAAHCVKPELYFARLGEYDVRTEYNEPHQDVKIKQVFKHSDYDDEIMLNDIAILALEQNVEFNDRVRPICLPIFGYLLNLRFVSSNPFVAGWGTRREDGPTSPILMQVQVPVNSNKKCKGKYRKINQLEVENQMDDRVLCAGFEAGGKDSCQGDSGGPLMLPIENNMTFPFYQIGIVSYGDGCGRKKVPGVYTNVQYFATWIKEMIA